MANFTKDYRDTIQDRLNQDSDFAQHLLDEAISLILNDEPETARLVLRDLVNATIGFEKLSDKTSFPKHFRSDPNQPKYFHPFLY